MNDADIFCYIMTKYAKNQMLNMFHELVPKVYEERFNKKSVLWAANAILETRTNKLHSFKWMGLDRKNELIR